MPKNGWPEGRALMPMSHWHRQARELGFELRVDTEPENFKVYAMLKPKTKRAKRAVDRALGEDCEFITATTVYDKASADMKARGIDPPPREDHDHDMAVGMDDTVQYALTMAQKALSDAAAA